MKTPSFFELRTIVEFVAEELAQSQLQELLTTEQGLVLGFYRFTREPRMTYLIFDLESSSPMLVLLDHNPWLKFKKVKPLGLFATAHMRNQFMTGLELKQDYGRVVQLAVGTAENRVTLEFRCITKQPNLIVRTQTQKSVSWFPVTDLQMQTNQYNEVPENEELRSIQFLFQEWKKSRFLFSAPSDGQTLTPFERWVKNKTRDRDKKKKAIESVQKQISEYLTEEWAEVGEYLKTHGLKNLKPEWSIYIDYKKSASENMQKCFEKAKAAKTKMSGAEQRLHILRQELQNLADLTEEKFKQSLILLENKHKKQMPRQVQGRLRKFELPGGQLVAYMGKSAADNMNLLRQSKPFDIWMHLKDYPSAHAIVHRQKNQILSDHELQQVARWLVSEGLSKSQTQMGGKYAVVFVECRHVKPLKGDKMGRVTYHNSREILIAL